MSAFGARNRASAIGSNRDSRLEEQGIASEATPLTRLVPNASLVRLSDIWTYSFDLNNRPGAHRRERSAKRTGRLPW
jgi:hypothetical protein